MNKSSMILRCKTFSFLKSFLFKPFSSWEKVPQAPPDLILGINEAFKKDNDSNKVNLGVGAYRDDNGKPWVLESVRKAETFLFQQNLDNEYLPIQGYEPFIEGSCRVAYEDSFVGIKEKRIAAIQSLSGTGAVRIGLDLCKKYLPEKTTVYVPEPSWPIHKGICQEIRMPVKEYKYYDPATKGLNFNGLKEDLTAAPEGSVVILHACAHNPTGVDLNKQQWTDLKTLFQQKKHIAFFDMAYQGFTSGNIHEDAFAVRLFANDLTADIPLILAQSFAKNFGLYGQRIGCLSTICSSEKEASDVQSQMKILARRIYSNPPLHGARIVSTILLNKDLYELWLQEVKLMADRIANMRKLLVNDLKNAGSTLIWDHITQQIGMFAFTGLELDEVKELANVHHIYLTLDGRISIAGLNTKNVTYVANAFHQVTKNRKK